MSIEREDWLDALGFARGGHVRLRVAGGVSTERWQERGKRHIRRVRARFDPRIGLPSNEDRKVLLCLLEFERSRIDVGEVDVGLERLAAAARERGVTPGRHALLASLHRLCGLSLHVTTYTAAGQANRVTAHSPFARWRALRHENVWASYPIRCFQSEVVPGHGRAMWYALRLDALFVDRAPWEVAEWTDLEIPPEHGGVVLP